MEFSQFSPPTDPFARINQQRFTSNKIYNEFLIGSDDWPLPVFLGGSIGRPSMFQELFVSSQGTGEQHFDRYVESRMCPAVFLTRAAQASGTPSARMLIVDFKDWGFANIKGYILLGLNQEQKDKLRKRLNISQHVFEESSDRVYIDVEIESVVKQPKRTRILNDEKKSDTSSMQSMRIIADAWLTPEQHREANIETNFQRRLARTQFEPPPGDSVLPRRYQPLPTIASSSLSSPVIHELDSQVPAASAIDHPSNTRTQPRQPQAQQLHTPQQRHASLWPPDGCETDFTPPTQTSTQRGSDSGYVSHSGSAAGNYGEEPADPMYQNQSLEGEDDEIDEIINSYSEDSKGSLMDSWYTARTSWSLPQDEDSDSSTELASSNTRGGRDGLGSDVSYKAGGLWRRFFDRW